MKKHTITKAEIDFEVSVKIAASTNKDEYKSLDLAICPELEMFNYVVRSQGKVVCETPSIDKAIKKYNEC